MYAEEHLKAEILKETIKKSGKAVVLTRVSAKGAHYKSISISSTSSMFGISETCYRYQAELSDKNADIADWLLYLTEVHRN